MAADIGTGATLTFASGLFANIMSMNWNGVARPAVKTSHLLTTSADTFIPGDRYDPGGLALELQFQPDALGPTALISQLNQGTTGITVTFPIPAGRSAGATMVGTGFLQDIDVTVPDEALMTMSATLKYTGTVTMTTSPV